MADEPEPLEDEPVEPVQLTLDDELDDGLSFGEWVESLPIELEAA